MAHIGMKYPVAAEWAEGNTYSDGFVVAKAINFTGTPNKNEAELYADDGVAETDRSVKDWGTSLGVDDLSLEIQAKLLGHTYVKATGDSDSATPESIEIGAEDEPPFFGMGFYKRRKKNGVTSFTAIWLYKVQNSEPTENAETKGESVNFQTATIEGKAYAVEVEGKMTFGKKLVFKTEAAAKKWLETQAKISRG